MWGWHGLTLGVMNGPRQRDDVGIVVPNGLYKLLVRASEQVEDTPTPMLDRPGTSPRNVQEVRKNIWGLKTLQPFINVTHAQIFLSE